METDVITPAQVSDWLGGVGESADPNDPNLLMVVDAVNAMVRAMPTAPVTPATDTDPAAWAPQTVAAAVMLGARLVRRRNSPGGVEAFLENSAAYVSRYDPDIGRMLRIDAYAPPQVG